jgi:hypothetical protein
MLEELQFVKKNKRLRSAHLGRRLVEGVRDSVGVPLIPIIKFTACALFGFAQEEPSPWHDPSPHTVQFVAVDEGVRLEVLDWGGMGRNIVLLASSQSIRK